MSDLRRAPTSEAIGAEATRWRFARALLCLLAAMLCYLAFFVSAEWSEAYLMHYGTFVLSRGELAFKLNLVLFILPAIVFLSFAIAELRRERLLVEFDMLERLGGSRLVPIVMALLVLGLVMVVRILVLRESVITDDENVYHFQARLLASGRLYASSVPEGVRAFFDNQYIINNGRWFGLYFVGHPAVLALALKAGLFEWVGAIEAAVTTLFAVGIARRLFGNRAALLTGSLLALSPYFVFVSATHLSQPTSLLFFSVLLYAALRIEEPPHAARWWITAAIALVCMVFVRPQTAVVLSLAVVGRIAWLWIRGALRPPRVGPVAACLLLIGGAAGWLAVNHALTGSAFKTGYHAWMGHWRAPFPFGPVHSIREASQSLAQVNFWLLGWPLSLAFVVFFERTSKAWGLATTALVPFVWYGSVAAPTVAAVGPVYYAETIVPLVILTASGIERSIMFARTRLGDLRLTRAVIAAPMAASLACLFAFVPFEIASLRLMVEVTQAPYDLVKQHGLDHALVFVRSLPAQHVSPGSWAYYHRNNSPDLDDSVLFVRDLGPERNQVLIRWLRDRRAYWMGMNGGRLALHPIDAGAAAAAP